ncbi:hypothetical protein DFH28DRAFT_952780 [Melampsora americana]|nr:hypothetical protein DFH28DRAFT_952780 [Melampsora americana]
MSSKSPTSTPKKPYPITPSSSIFNFITPISSRHHPTSYYTPLSQHDETPTIPIYVGSQLTYTPVSNGNLRASRHSANEGRIHHSHLDLLVAQRSGSRLRWLAGLAGAMLMAMLLCGNRLGSTQQFVLPLRSVTQDPTDFNSSATSTNESSTSWHSKLTATHSILDEERYLFPIHIGEQETKASSHLLQLGLLAHSLNRTLVLPRVGSGYISQCGLYSFETYYSSHALARWDIRTISQTELGGKLKNPVTAQLVALSRKSISPTFYSTSVREGNLAETRCISAELQKNLIISPSLLEISGASGWHRCETSRSVFRDALVSNLALQDHVPFLLVDWKIIYPLFNPVPTYGQLEYNPLLNSLAKRLVELLGGPSNVIGIHWRQETVPLPVIERCSELLEGSLPPGEEEWLWIASDYPFESLLGPAAEPDTVPRAHSGTFHTLTTSHHLSMSNMVATLQKNAETTQKRKLTTLHTLLDAHALDEPLVESFLGSFGGDRGVLGIVEKLVLMRIDRIIVGSENGDKNSRCSKGSSYSRQIVKMHQELETNHVDGKGRREVSFWG